MELNSYHETRDPITKIIGAYWSGFLAWLSSVKTKPLFFLPIFISIVSLNGCGLEQARHRPNQDSSLVKPVEHDLSDLTRYLGKRPSAVGLWTLPEVEHHMTLLMGDENYMEFLFLMQDALPLKKERVIFSTGVLPDDAIQALALVIFDTYNSTVYAEMIYSNRREVFTSSNMPVFMPAEVLSRREAFGIIPPEKIARSFPMLYSGKKITSSLSEVTYQLHLDSTGKRFLIHEITTNPQGKTVTKRSGRYTINHCSNNLETLELKPEEGNPGLIRLLVDNETTLKMLEGPANDTVSILKLVR